MPIEPEERVQYEYVACLALRAYCKDLRYPR